MQPWSSITTAVDMVTSKEKLSADKKNSKSHNGGQYSGFMLNQ